EPELWQRLPEWTEESFAGVLANVTAGRVANRFDLGGANYTVDAACASSLTVIDLALSELRTGRSNMVVAAGIDLEQTPYFYEGFSRVQAFSPTGFVRSFDETADGIVISEGIVVVLLKRLADAERDGDKIYALIQSAAGSSDGKGLGMTAPRSIGQRRALRRAYEEAGCSPATIGLYEAHGTGTPVGDRAELETVVAVLEESGAASKSCAVGSVKSLLGHTKAAAGMVGLAKAALALHYRTLPPHAHVERPLPALADGQSPVYIQAEARPWLQDGGQPRRAGVSAFGFGGTNFHAVLEEYRGRVEVRAPGEDLWPWELLVWRAAGRQGLLTELTRLREQLGAEGVAAPRLADLAYTLALRAEERRALPTLLAVVADSVERLTAILDTVTARLVAQEADPVGPLGHLAWEVESGNPPRLAFLFPGQGAQAPDMARESTLYLPELRDAFELAEQLSADRFGRPLSQIVFPPTAFNEEESLAQRQRIDNTHVAQTAIGALSSGLLDFTRRLGLTPTMVAGHSYGELTALHAAGALSRADFLGLSELRGRLMAEAPPGAMAAVQLAAEELAPLLSPGDEVVIANRNAPDQCVLSGATEAIAAVVERLTAGGVRARLLPVSGAFHSPLMATVEEPLAEAIAHCAFTAPRVPVYGNATAAPYGETAAAVAQQLATHLRSPVDFLGQVRRMYDDGARVFLEVGPGRALTGMVERTLGDRPHFAALALDAGGGLKGLLLSLGGLLKEGVGVDLAALFAGRRVDRLDLESLPTAAPSAGLWKVDGGRVRRPGEAVGTMGKLPLLDLEALNESSGEAPRPEPRPAATQPVLQPAQPAGKPAIHPAAIQPAREVSPSPFKTRPTAASPPTAAPPAAGGLALEAYRAYQETMRQFLAVQESVMANLLGRPAGAPELAAATWPATIATVAVPPVIPAAEPAAVPAAPAGGSAAELPLAASPLPLPAPSAAPEEAEPAVVIDRDHLAATVVGLVSERTGYPAEMLDLQQDIEADLGIDSIKRVEILSAIQDRLPDAPAVKPEHFGALRTLRQIAEFLDQSP
ncbi:MAG TPA: acyltransferase domain-containing protein, partial [Thermoanaerobaculia bacterium]|nr:acyltransferase domain-containing protein [Thermoanaerobaculia bacterium]